MTKREEKAISTFKSGCNCAQSVLTSFNDILRKDEKDLLSIASGFGGGMGKMQQTCGAVTGAFMVFGLYAGMKTTSNSEAKELSEKMVRSFNEKFKAEKGSTSCRDILGVDMHSEEGKLQLAEKNLFGTVCADVVGTAALIVEELIENET